MDQNKIVVLIDLILSIARRSMRLGMAVLDKESLDTDNPWLKKGLMLILRGLDSVNIDRVFRNLETSQEFASQDLIELRIIHEAMVSLCRRDSINDMEDLMFSVIGDRGRDYYDKQKIQKQEKKVQDFISNPQGSIQGSPAGEMLKAFSDRQLTILLDQINPELLAPFLAGETHAAQCRILSLVDKETQSDIVDQLETGFLEMSIEKAQKLVSYRIRRIGGEFRDEEILSQKEVDALLKQNR
jgi:hypothetical protein